jgi:hypothetical protein
MLSTALDHYTLVWGNETPRHPRVPEHSGIRSDEIEKLFDAALWG